MKWRRSLSDNTKKKVEQIIREVDTEAVLEWKKSVFGRTWTVKIKGKKGLRDNQDIKEKIAALGHEVGLHFLLFD